MKKGGPIRKIRSDKKRDVKPTISYELKDNIYRLSNLCKIPVKDIGEMLCIAGVDSEEVIHKLSPYFKREVRLRNTIYRGSFETPVIKRSRLVTSRITIKFEESVYENMALLAYTLDVTPSRAVAILLDTSLRDTTISGKLLRDNLKVDWMSNSDRFELGLLMAFVKSNRNEGDSATWIELMKYAAEEVGDFVVNGWRKE